MQHGDKVRFIKKSDWSEINREDVWRDGIVIEANHDMVKILALDTKKIVFEKQQNVLGVNCFFGENDGCGYCKFHKTALSVGRCSRGILLKFSNCGEV